MNTKKCLPISLTFWMSFPVGASTVSHHMHFQPTLFSTEALSMLKPYIPNICVEDLSQVLSVLSVRRAIILCVWKHSERWECQLQFCSVCVSVCVWVCESMFVCLCVSESEWGCLCVREEEMGRKKKEKIMVITAMSVGMCVYSCVVSVQWCEQYCSVYVC